jgi:hypothetical protein
MEKGRHWKAKSAVWRLGNRDIDVTRANALTLLRFIGCYMAALMPRY